MRRRLLAFGILTLAATSAVLHSATLPGFAHATLLQSSPAADAVLPSPPGLVELLFSEPVEPGLGRIEVVAPDGSRADDGSLGQDEDAAVVRVPVNAEREGTYTVAWSVVSADGHPISGSFLFSVGHVTDPAELSETSRTPLRFAAGVARWLAYAGTILLVGCFAFYVLVAPDALRRLRPLMLAGALLALVGSAGVLASQVALASGGPLLEVFDVLGEAISDTRFSRLTLIRAACALAVVLLLMVRRIAGSAAGSAAIGVLSGVLVAIPALTGHAWTADDRWPAVVSDVVHLGAAAIWIGGLAALLAVARERDRAHEAATRFASIALAAAVAVGVAGVVSGYLQVESIDDLTGTRYGRLLLVKAALFTVLVVLGWLNRSRFLALLPENHKLFGVVRVELAVAALVVAATAALVNLPPTGSASEVVQPFSSTVALLDADDVAVGELQIEVVPANTGGNDVHLYFFDLVGQTLAVDAIELQVSRDGVPPRKVEVTPQTPDHASAFDVIMPTAGTWTLDLTAVRAGQPATAVVEVPIR